MSDNGGNAELLHVYPFDTVCRVVLLKAWDSETEATNGRSSVPRHLARGTVLPNPGPGDQAQRTQSSSQAGGASGCHRPAKNGIWKGRFFG